MSEPSPLPRLVAGLGNPGLAYRGTRHNVGFQVVEGMLARVRCVAHEVSADADRWTVEWQGRVVYLLKPLTYMNASGRAVRQAMLEWQVPTSEVLVVCDCIDLEFGRLRLRPRGRSGGHRGLESIIREVGCDGFARLRLGVGRATDGEVVEHVLSAWRPSEVAGAGQLVETAVAAVLTALAEGVTVAMNRYNAYRVPDDRPTGQETGTSSKEMGH